MAVLWVFVSAFPDSELALIFLPFVPFKAINMAFAIAVRGHSFACYFRFAPLLIARCLGL
jgi:hypothetical protein